VKWPCFYGIDFATPAELIANGLSVEEIRRSIGADSLAYIDLEELVEATTVPVDKLCRACFDGVYPIGVPQDSALGRDLLADDVAAQDIPVGQPLPQLVAPFDAVR
jgi:amidophosphoribosyltransferase